MTIVATLLLTVHASSPSLRVTHMPTSSVRRSNVLACAAEDVRAELEAKLKEAVAREDYKAAAVVKAELDAAPVPVKKLYASLQQRASQLSSRRELCVQEREHIRGLADAWPAHELAQQSLWEHWFGEYGDEARERLVAAEGEAAQLESLVDEFPDWVEPANRLATLRYIEGDYHDSIALCLKILRQKPWHFGAGR